MIKIDGSGNGDCAIVVYEGSRRIYSNVWRNIASTNNEAEYSALINALKYVGERNITDEVEIYSDSQLVCKQIRGEYSVKKNTLIPLYLQAKKMLDSLGNVRLTWVPRSKVSEADELMREDFESVSFEESEKPVVKTDSFEENYEETRFGLVQMDIIQNESEKNFSRILSFLERGAAGKMDMLLFPETCITGFPSDFHENMKALVQNDYLREISKKCREMNIGAGIGFFKEENNEIYNCYSIIGKDGSIICEQYKQSLFAIGNEDKGVCRGTDRRIFEFRGLKVKIAICFEVRFPEIFFENDLTNQPDVFIVPANWPSRRKDIWQSLLTARAIENQSWVLGINRTSKRKIVYTGSTMAVSPAGEIVASADMQENLLLVSIDRKEICDFRNSFNILPERSKIFNFARGK